MRPQIGFDAVTILEASGAQVVYPPTQTCCGQIAYNSGYTEDALAIARKCAREFADCEKVVLPSGSCCGMFRTHLPAITDDAEILKFASKCMELSEYLTTRNYTPPVTDAKTVKPMTITYHDSCSGLRELGTKNAPRQFLQACGVEIIEMNDCEECCGFGGRFAEQFAPVSVAMAQKKCANILAAKTKDGAAVDAVGGGDLGCLLQIEGWLRRHQHPLPVLHWVQLLARHHRATTADT